MSEGLFANGCTHGLHLPDDLCLVENVDRDGRAVPPGQPGERILVTNLYNPTLPLIRYEVTDEVRVIPGPCPCGSVLRRIADPQGRLDDTFAYPDGTTVHPHVFRDVLGQHPTLVEYQVRQTPRGADIAIVTAGPTDEAALAEQHRGCPATRRPGTSRRHDRGRHRHRPPEQAASSNASFPSDVDQRSAGVRAAAVCKVRSRRSARRRATRLTRSMYAMSESRAFSAAGDRRSRFATSQ